MNNKKYKKSYTRMIALGFALIILTGTVLLMLPAASRSGVGTPFADALFTATSATCVTGLVVADTWQHWTLFGQLVIITLIQIGGLGFVTLGAYIAVLLKKRIGLREREAIHESVSTIELAGVVRLTKRIVKGTILFELVGALLLSTRFIPDFGWARGIYFSIFHAISAFCNAGFDLMGANAPYSSLVAYEGDIIVNITIMTLIIVGGIGFIVWDDLYRNRLHFRKYLLHTRIVLSVTAFLIIGGALLLYLYERNNLFAGMSAKDTILGALFSSVTARTAGFNTIDTGLLTEGSKFTTIILMFIGGSPGSTAGGLKTTTLAALLLSMFAALRGTSSSNVFNRRLEEDAVKRASAVFVIDIGLAVSALFLIMALQPVNFLDVFFEVASAIGTVGMTTGITRDLNVPVKMIIALLMYCGRLGSLSFALIFAQKKKASPVQNPMEKIIVG